MLDTRLKMVYDLVPNGTLCDIGTDHAKLPVFAVKNGKCERAFACDLRKGPLSSADANIKQNGLENKIKTVLSNGFCDIEDADFKSVNCFVLAGMGGELIMNILSAKKTNAYLVLQPQSAIYELVEYLKDGGYSILKQCFCMDKHRKYTAMLVKFTGESNISGLFNNCQKTDAFYAFLQSEKERLQKAGECIRASKAPDSQRLERIDYILEQIGRNLNESN